MKTSVIWKCDKKEFQKIINNSSSFREVIRFFGLVPVAGNYKTLNNRIQKDSIDLIILNSNRNTLLKKNGGNSKKQKYSDKEVFVENSTYGRKDIKKRIIRSNLIPYKCLRCGLKDEWCDEKLVLVLDHINGKNDDNRLENLRFLCPNCNSQTPTFSGKNTTKLVYICPSCNKEFSGYGKQCVKCWQKNQPKKFRIKTDELKKLIEKNFSFLKIGKMYGVSGNTVKNRCQIENLL